MKRVHLARGRVPSPVPVACFLILSILALAAPPANAGAAAVSFKGRTITVIIPTTPGAGTDLSARLVGRYLGKYLPGRPSVVASNVPGGHGVIALNYLAQQARPDGSTVAMSSTSQADPINYRKRQSHYDPTKFAIVGSLGTGDGVMIIRRDALARLYDKTATPVAMGSVSGLPRSSMRMAVWGRKFLGWNIRWVSGYPGSSDLVIALERGEIDMTAFPRAYLRNKLTDVKKYKVLYRDGLDKAAPASGRADADTAPFFTDAMAGKIKDPKALAAYNYWRAERLFKWMALPPKTPDAVRDAYRAAFLKATADPKFLTQARKISRSLSIISPADTVRMIHALAVVPNEALGYTDSLMRAQGIKTTKKRKKKRKKKS